MKRNDNGTTGEANKMIPVEIVANVAISNAQARRSTSEIGSLDKQANERKLNRAMADTDDLLDSWEFSNDHRVIARVTLKGGKLDY